MKRLLWLCLMLALPSVALATTPPVINEQGSSEAAVSVGACSGAATEIFPSSNTTTTWSFMPEGADIRCTLRAIPDATASPAPTATVGFLFKSNILVNESTLGIGSNVAHFGMDCCGVAGAVPVDTWRE